MEWLDIKEQIEMSDIEAMEAYFNLCFPKEYVYMQLQFHGGRPRPNRFTTLQQREATVRSFLTVTRNERGNVFDVFLWLKDRLPKKIIPFARDDAGNYVCFSFYYLNHEPAVVFWNHERNFEFELISETFREFVNSLY